MIISIHNSATSEERSQLMTLLHRISGSHHPVTTTRMSGREVIVLDLHLLDAAAQSAINEQAAVERITHIKTPYKLVSREFQAADTSIVVGKGHTCTPVTVGGKSASPHFALPVPGTGRRWPAPAIRGASHHGTASDHRSHGT